MSNIDIECFRGDTKSWALTVTNDNVPVDLTGATLTMSARRSFADTTYVFQRTSAGQGITIDPDQATNTGKAIIKLASASTSALASDTVELRYDIQVVTAAGDQWTVASGTLTVNPDVST